MLRHISLTSLFFSRTMKRFIGFILALVVISSLYNFSIIKSSLMGFFGDVSYGKNDLVLAKIRYENVLKTLSGSTLLQADALYNLGNTLYRL